MIRNLTKWKMYYW